MSHVLLSGCTDHEYSYDAQIGERYHGAMTYHAIKAITDANFRSDVRRPREPSAADA